MILDSITALPLKENKFSIIAYTVDGQITELVFSPNENQSYTRYSGTFPLNLDILLVEHLKFENSRVFALGSNKGSIFLVRVTQGDNNMLNTEFLAEVKSSSLVNKITSYIFSAKPEAIICLKYIGNNLLCYITDKFQFKIWNVNLKTEIFSKHLIKNVSDEVLKNARILANSVKLNDEDVKFSESKCFNFLVYMEYNSAYVLAEFDIIFSNIPEHGIKTITGQRDFESFYNFIELGTDLHFKNSRIYKLDGKLIDFLVYEDKFFCLTQLEEENTSQIFFTSTQKDPSYNYELKIWIGAKKPSIFNLFDYDRIYLNYLLTLLNSSINNNKIQRKLIASLFANSSHYEPNFIVRFFNNKFKSDFNITQIPSFIQKLNTNDLIQIISELNESMITNEAISLCSFITNEVEGLGIIRRNGLSFVKPLSDWEGMNEKVLYFENSFRKMIDLTILNEGTQREINVFRKNIYNQINTYLREDKANVLPLIFSLLRVYLTEVFLLLEDESYVMECLSHSTIEEFIQSNIQNNITNQFSNLSFLDVFNEMIKNLHINYRNIIEETSNHLQEELTQYLNNREIQDELIRKVFHNNSTPLISDQRYLNSQFVLNPKLSELVTKLSFNKIQGLYHLSRDLLTFTLWKDTVIEDVKKLFIRNYSSYLLSTHYIGQNPLLHLTINENLFRFGREVFEDKRSNCVDLVTVLLYNRDISVYKNLLHLKEFKLLLLLIKLETREDLLFLEILCHANMEDVPRMKEGINIFFTNIHSKGLEDNILSKIESISGERLSGLSTLKPTMAAFLYLEKQLIYILKEQYRYEFYFHCFSFIHLDQAMNNSLSIESFNFFIEMIRSCIKIDPDLAIICYSNIKTKLIEGAEMKIVEIFAEFFEEKYDPKFVEKILLHPNLVEGICQALNQKCNSYNLETVKQILNYSHVNHFNILFNILCCMKNFSEASLVYFNWANLIANTILTDRVDPLQLIKLLKEQRNALENVLICLNKSEEKENVYLQAEDGQIKFITKDEISSLIAKLSAKIEMIDISRDVNSVDDECSLLNSIFRNKLFYIITKYELIRYVDVKTGRKLIINCIKNASSLINSDQMNLLILQVIGTDNLDYMWTLTESFFFEGLEVPKVLSEKVLRMNPNRFMQLAVKYRREQEIEETIIYMSINNIDIPKETVEVAAGYIHKINNELFRIILSN